MVSGERVKVCQDHIGGLNVKKFFSLVCFFIVFLTVILVSLAYAANPCFSLGENREGNAILNALRRGLQEFPERYSLPFHYQREDVEIEGETEILLIVKELNVEGSWAWVEVEGENESYEIDALLYQDGDTWVIKGMVNPRYFVCPEREACMDVKGFIYTTFSRQFPLAPSAIFPEVHPERKTVLTSFSKGILAKGNVIYLVRFFEERDGWAWIETDPRTMDGMGQFEPTNALLHREEDQWKVVELEPCCGEHEEHPGVKQHGDFVTYLKNQYPQVPKEIFPHSND